jgi:FkbM family methyltransferase
MGVSLRVAEMLTKVRRALYSRYLFDNWFPLLIRDILTRLGFNVKLVARVGDCTFELSPETFERFVSRFSRGFIKSVECVNGKLLVNGIEVDIIDDVIRDTETWAKVLGWDYDTVDGFWFKDNVKFRHMRSTILEIFDYGEYVLLDVKGKDIVDVGAYVGDSAIYFVLKGARRVFAVEPHPGAYTEMLDNIKLNNMEKVIIPINAGLASRPGSMCVENVDISHTGGTYHRPGDCINAVPAMTLGELMGRFGVDPNDAVLKMDCEGCEFDVILNDYDHVRLFRELILEYHPRFVNKSLNDLLKVLGKDYKCDIRGNEDLGIMHCTRKW